MISLQPIHKKIRKTLFRKSKAVSRDFSGEELGPVDMDAIRETYAKTTWVKMFSPVDNTKDGGLNTVSIVNGVLDNKDEELSDIAYNITRKSSSINDWGDDDWAKPIEEGKK